MQNARFGLGTGLLAVLVFLVGAATARADDGCGRDAEVVFVVDQSSSMNDPVPGASSKWVAARQALMEVAGAREGQGLGLVLFPSPEACGPGEWALGMGEATADALALRLEQAPPPRGNFTPLAQTLERLGSDGLPPGAAVVLVTDGWQWCDPYDASMRGASVEAAARLREQGHPVHVVGFGSGVDARSLHLTAIAGGTPRLGCDADGDGAELPLEARCYHPAQDAPGLLAALMEVSFLPQAERCDGVDNDCDGLIDEGHDLDGDGFASCGGDCDDLDPSIHRGAAERCDGVDRDCDGRSRSDCECTPGQVEGCGLPGVCFAAERRCGDDGRWGDCTGPVMPTPELCDDRDEDCDGLVDEEVSCPGGGVCENGLCFLAPDAGGPQRGAPSGAGCLCSVEGQSDGAWWGLGALAVWVWGRRRRLA